MSELRKPEHRADPGVRAWIASRAPSDLHLSVLTIMEIEIGIGRLGRRDSLQAARLRAWLNDVVLTVFAGRILPLDLAVARRAAQLHVPDPRPERDAMIAATASVHGLTVVTRNVKDFDPLHVAIIDPWTTHERR
ncbi:type II toxin-antitoxin system VapC family toxin [Rathayibacter tanaceti]|uniref:type II toxin-antitoxin system VapC family toxin n=1 Tax=Rathayibacter tanaceti TaxID=1671680 RepID=UPI001F34FB17|nr:type II toxin-antitoxin system VapC family toxin [Rathayibacter tanaceti]